MTQKYSSYSLKLHPDVDSELIKFLEERQTATTLKEALIEYMKRVKDIEQDTKIFSEHDKVPSRIIQTVIRPTPVQKDEYVESRILMTVQSSDKKPRN